MLKRAAAVVAPVALVALAVVPLLIDQPFGAQTPGSLAAAFYMRRWSPFVTLAAGVLYLTLVAVNWRRMRMLGRSAAVVALAVVASTMWFTRQNPFEWMFNPLPGSRYLSASSASFVQPGDIVLAVRVGDDAAAYPVRQMAYHHLVNDRIGGSPAVVTY